MAATYSPTTQCSTIGDAVSLPSPLCARLRLYPAPLMHREDNGAAHSWDITKKVSLKKNRGLSLFSSDARDDKDEWLTVGGYKLPDFLEGII